MTSPLTVPPAIEHRAEQPYIGLKAIVTLETIPTVEQRIPDLLAWLAADGHEPAGAPFIRYDVIDMFRRLEIEAGVPVAAGVRAAGEFHSDVIPAGRYVTYTHTGHPDEHIPVISAIFDWATAQDLVFDTKPTPEGDWWGGRFSFIRAGSHGGPDTADLETEFAFRLAD